MKLWNKGKSLNLPAGPCICQFVSFVKTCFLSFYLYRRHRIKFSMLFRLQQGLEILIEMPEI